VGLVGHGMCKAIETGHEALGMKFWESSCHLHGQLPISIHERSMVVGADPALGRLRALTFRISTLSRDETMATDHPVPWLLGHTVPVVNIQ